MATIGSYEGWTCRIMARVVDKTKASFFLSHLRNLLECKSAETSSDWQLCWQQWTFETLLSVGLNFQLALPSWPLRAILAIHTEEDKLSELPSTFRIAAAHLCASINICNSNNEPMN